MSVRAFTVPMSGVSTCTGHQVITMAGSFNNITITSDLPSQAGQTRCVFVSAGSPVAIASASDGYNSYSIKVPLSAVTVGNANPIPAGTMLTGAINGKLLTINFSSTVSNLTIVVQHWS